MNIPESLRYTKDHEWLKVEKDIAWIGITDFAQSELGDIVYVDVEKLGETIAEGEVFGTVEAVKTVSDLFMPISGEIIEINDQLADDPSLVNQSPYDKGWIIKVQISKPEEVDALLTATQYKENVA